jgi:SOS-response transcriptional repressor LexA
MPVRIPVSKIDWVKNLLKVPLDNVTIQPSTNTCPHYEATVSAGTPVGIEDSASSPLNFHQYLIDDAEGSFAVTVAGDSMINAGILDGDIVIVNAKRKVFQGDIIVAEVDGSTTLKKIVFETDHLMLHAANPDVSNIRVDDDQNFRILGVVVGLARRF